MKVEANTSITCDADARANLTNAAHFLNHFIHDDYPEFVAGFKIPKAIGMAIWTDVNALACGTIPPSLTDPPYQHISETRKETDDSEQPVESSALSIIKPMKRNNHLQAKNVDSPATHQPASPRSIFTHTSERSHQRAEIWEELMHDFHERQSQRSLKQTNHVRSILKYSTRVNQRSPKHLASARVMKKVQFGSPLNQPSPLIKGRPRHRYIKFENPFSPLTSGKKLFIPTPTAENQAISPILQQQKPQKIITATKGLFDDDNALFSELRLSLSDTKSRELSEIAAAREEAEKQAREEQEKKARETLLTTAGLRDAQGPVLALPTEKMVCTAKSVANPSIGVVTTSIRGDEIKGETFLRIIGATEWLNDEAVNSALECLVQDINKNMGIDPKINPKVVAVGSNSYDFIAKTPLTKLARPLKRQGITPQTFATAETILVPRCINSHWTLGVIRPQDKLYFHLDSLRRGNGQDMLDVLRKMIEATVGNVSSNIKEWGVATISSERQHNGYDCGMFTILNSICISTGARPHYHSCDMPRLRYTIANIILNRGFDGISSLDIVAKE